MRVRFIRHATFVFEAGRMRVLVDPMLGSAGAPEPVANTPNGRRATRWWTCTRDELKDALDRGGLTGRGEIPASGETLSVP